MFSTNDFPDQRVGRRGRRLRVAGGAVAAGAVARAGGDVRATAAAAVTGAREAMERSPQALDVLLAACGAAGLTIRQDSQSYGFTGSAARGRASGGAFAFGGGATNNLFSSGVTGSRGRGFGSTASGRRR